MREDNEGMDVIDDPLENITWRDDCLINQGQKVSYKAQKMYAPARTLRVIIGKRRFGERHMWFNATTTTISI